jgi:hypothetical protein
MALTAEQLRLREGKITASFLPQLMAGDAPAIYAKWLELIGDPAWEPEDNTNNWPMHFGSFVESFALDWHQRRTGRALVRRGEVVDHPSWPGIACTLDAFRADDRCAIDVKCCGAFQAINDICNYYSPQLICQRACTAADRVAILLVHGGAEPIEIPVDIDRDYETAVWQRVREFQHCVENLTPPVTLDIKRIVPPEQWRAVDLNRDSEQYNWSGEMIPLLVTWADTEAHAKQNAEAKEKIKVLLPDDVGHVTYAGLIIARNRAGAVSIKRARIKEA